MEGGGECMVAIIKGLRDAGISVTVFNDWPEDNTSKILAKNNSYGTAEKRSSVETNTNHLKKYNTSSQICDGHFASSYQVGHCGLRPTSPPVQLSEFPPQRTEATTGHGNFEIGGTGGQSYLCPPQTSSWSYRELASADRGALDNGTHENDTFAQSLRKYPNVPTRTLSAELVHRLLTYTQAKNLTKSSYHTRIRRSVKEKNDVADKETRTNSSKNIQTYARMKRSSKESGNITDKDIHFGECSSKTKGFSCKNNVVRSKDNDLNFIYDYLKGSNPLRNATGRSADVRYLTDVKKCIRDTVRQMCQEQPVVCPRIRSRYSNHRREHHRLSFGQELNSHSNVVNTKDRASSPLTSEVSMMTQCEASSNNLRKCSAKVSLCCICKKPLPCSCKPGSSKCTLTKVLKKCACIANSSDLKDKVMKKISDWIISIPVYANESKGDKEKRENMVKELAEVLEKAITDNDLEIVRKEVDTFLNCLPMWCPEDDNEKKIFKNKITDKLIGELRYLGKRNGFTDEIANWVDNITFEDNEAGVLNADDIVQELEKRIKSIKRRSYDDDYKDDLISVITNVLEDLPIKTDSKRNHSIHYLANDLANKLIKVKRDNSSRGLLQNTDEVVDEDLERSVIDEISDIFDNTDIHLTITEKTMLQNKIAEILSKNVQNFKNYITGNTKKDIIDLLKEETGIEGPSADLFANSLINKVKVMSLPNQKKTSGIVSGIKRTKNDIGESVKEEVNDIFNTFKVEVEDRDTLEDTLSKLLEDEIIRGVDVNKVRHEIYNLLFSANISEGQVENISDELISRAREMSLSYKTKDSTVSLSTRAQLYENSFKKNAAQVMSDFVKTLDDNDNPQIKSKVKEVSDNFIDNVAEIMLHSDYNKNDLHKEILLFLENLPIKSKIPKDELAGQLMKTLQNINIHISTPHKEKTSFRPRRESTGSTISSIHFEDLSYSKQPIIPNAEEKYNKELMAIFDNWVNHLPMDFNATDVNGFRHIMINDLVADIIDRQKYLQLNPNTKVSDKDELEHLKYQVFRWLNKLPNFEDLTDIMIKTESLMDEINNVPVPRLVKPISNRKDIKLREGKIPTYMDALQDEISFWLDEIPKDLCTLMNKSQLDIIIADLAGRIQELNNTDTDVEKEIMGCLIKMTKNASQSQLNKITQNLINRLKAKGFTDEVSWITVQNTSQFIEENLNGALMDWLKHLPLYQARNSQERFVQEKIVSDLAKDMRGVFDSLKSTSLNIDTEKLFIDEIVKHLKRFPMEIEKKTDEHYIKSLAQQLLMFLKGLQIFQDISVRRLTFSDESLEDSIDDWFQSLALVSRSNSIEKVQLEELSEQFKFKLKQLKQHNADDQAILKEIYNYLTALPIEVSKKNNERYLNDKAQQLLNSLQTLVLKQNEPSHLGEFEDMMSNIESNFGPKEGFKKAADILYENIESWCEKLPIYGSDIPEERDRVKAVKQNIASKLINKIGELNLDPEIFYDDFIYDDLLKDEIENLLNVLPINKEIEKDSENLKLNLFNKIKEVKEKTKHELAGHLYKQRLRDVVSKTLPSHKSFVENDEPFFENLKGDVADAFINLHYFGAKEELRNKFKTKINEQIAEFCSNYLKRFPATPIDNSKLNRELYSALKNVPVPAEESIRNEVEETRIKYEIQEWMKELPLKIQTVQDKQYTSKITSIMSKRLHGIEKDKTLISDYTERLKTEIIKWMKKIPLIIEGEREIEHFAEKLIEKLKNTEESRRFSASWIQSMDEDLTDSSTTSEKIISHSQLFTSSSLTPEDHATLQRIKERTTSAKKVQDRCKDAPVSPCPIDAESQTELRHFDSSATEFGVQQTPSTQAATQVDIIPELSSTRIRREKNQSQCGPCSSYAQDTSKSRPVFNKSSKNRLEVSPRVIVKEYHWNSTQETSSPCQNQPCLDLSELRQPLLKIQSNSCGISSVPCPQSCVSTQTARYAPPQQKHAEEIRNTKRSDPRFNQASLEEESSIPQSTFCRPEVPILGSLDAGQSSAPQRPDYEWSSVNFPENNDFLNTPCSRRRIVPSREDIGPSYTLIRERRDEKVKCTCRERILAKCSGRNRGPSCHNHDSLKQCPRCCGTHCPYPSYLYFRQ